MYAYGAITDGAITRGVCEDATDEISSVRMRSFCVRFASMFLPLRVSFLRTTAVLSVPLWVFIGVIKFARLR